MSVDRGFTWLDDETLALIHIWGKEEIQDELNTAKRNFSVYERIAQELSDVGFSRTAYQCREKIKRLRKEYQIARYCVLHNISQKKPMKYYEQVDNVLNPTTDGRNQDVHNVPYSDPEEEMQFNLKNEFDTSSSSGPSTSSPLIVSLTSSTGEGGVKMRVCMNSDEPSQDSNDTLIDNEEECHSPEEGSDVDDTSPWVPNVVLVENNESSLFENNATKDKQNDENVGDDEEEQEDEEDRRQEPPSLSHELPFSDEGPPPRKRLKKCPPKAAWFKNIMDRVTEKFLTYQETVDARFLERVAALERERIKRDEALQKLWMEFEERRRKDEQQHELKMMSLFGQFVNQILCGEDTNSK